MLEALHQAAEKEAGERLEFHIPQDASTLHAWILVTFQADCERVRPSQVSPFSFRFSHGLT